MRIVSPGHAGAACIASEDHTAAARNLVTLVHEPAYAKRFENTPNLQLCLRDFFGRGVAHWWAVASARRAGLLRSEWLCDPARSSEKVRHTLHLSEKHGELLRFAVNF